MKKRIFSLNLKQIALITGPLAIVALFICSSFMHITHGIITGSIFQITSDLNQKVEHEIRMAFEPPTFALNTIVASSKENQNQSVIQNLLSATADQYPQCAAFYYGSSRREASGGFFATSQEVPYSDGIDHTERGWFTGAIAHGGELFVTMQNPASSNEQAYITFSRAVIDQRGNTVGVAGCDILLSRLAQIVSDAKISQHASVSIINKEGLYLTNPNQSYIMKRSYFEDSRLPEKLRNAENYLGEKRLPFIQDNMFFAVRKLADTPWYVVIEGPLSDFTKKITNWMLIILLVVVLLIVSCVIFNGILINTMRKKEAAAGEQLMAETQNLVVAAKENAATSQDQSAAVKEIVATMEDNTALSESISTKITDVSTVATKTNDDVVDGVGYLEANVRQLHEISDANQTTIDGIKALGGKIE
ncbi:MAG: methyl-accepting chemotaxis protein, partial [Treponema sp.]|nr:methyl-accepting chemotaxis protein [Treponema sp.]